MDFNKTLQILQEKGAPPEGSLMSKVWKKFSAFGVKAEGRNKIVYSGRDITEFILLVKEYLTKVLDLTPHSGDEFWNDKTNEFFKLSKLGNRVEMVFNEK